MSAAVLRLSRAQVLAFRRRVGALDARLPASPDAVRAAAWAGFQDSMPRAALLSIHARVTGTGPESLSDPALVQLWGPRFSAYVVAAADVAVFTLGRLPDDPAGRRRATETADRLETFLDGRRMSYAEAGHGMDVPPNSLRYAAPTGRVLLHWDGARRPEIWMAPEPAMGAGEARLELARRYLHVFGPGTVEGFSAWAGLKPPAARSAFEKLAGFLIGVRTPAGDGLLLAADEPAVRAAPGAAPAPVRLLPSGDAFYLLQGRDRTLLVPDADHRAQLWTSRVWPGALLLDGEPAGTWRRAEAVVVIAPWRPLQPGEREAVEAEALSLPLPELPRDITVRWEV
ncbi:MAG: crosslink repair DNA glycosylase YcaQ family protein [Chloroflexota bacterium]